MAVSRCMDPKEERNDPRGRVFAGSAKCGNCHREIHTSFTGTAHSLSSAIASKKSIKGNFTSPLNEYYYRSDVKVVMEERDSSFFQVAYQNNIEKRASRFDIVIGSGRKAQTFLYWDNDNIFQLPVSWSVAANNWVNSPNYPPHQVRFDRNIPVGCFECHGSYIKVTSNSLSSNRIIDNFDRNQAVFGIDCERCHGPAAAHVYFHEQHPQEKKPAFINTYTSLQRGQKIDMCAQCHSGIHQMLQTIFRFKPGDTLTGHFFAQIDSIKTGEVDVHGSQTQLLQASRCFLESNDMTCTTCHNTHTNERKNMAAFSQRCMNCHTSVNHNSGNVALLSQTAIANNCIDCHMPASPSKLITLLSNGQDTPSPNLVRTHFISIYPAATSQFTNSNIRVNKN